MREERPNRAIRLAEFLTGVALAAAAWPLAFLAAVVAGGGHNSPFGHSALEATFGIALIAVPLLLFLLGIALMRASFTGGHKIAAAIGLLIPIDAAIASAAMWKLNQPPPPVMMPAPDPNAVIPATSGPMGQPVIAVTACYPGRGCTTAPPRNPEQPR